MRKVALVFWLMVPILVAAYHYGPGQQRLRTDDAASLIRQGDAYVAQEEWLEAVDAYRSALEVLPEEEVHVGRRVRLELAKAQMFISQLPEANRDLKALVEEMQHDANADAELLTDARDAAANAQYYQTWLMRLEGLSREQWEPEIEAARQTYKMLAENAEDAGKVEDAKRYQEDLESTIRLARMDLTELQGLPLPSQ